MIDTGEGLILIDIVIDSLSLRVRAWGLDLESMKTAIAAGVDGMTVNFPDVLGEYLMRL